MENIKRREALKRAAWFMGGVVSAPTVAGILNGCTPKPELAWTPTFFTEDQALLVSEVAEGIIPETDTPGAKKLGVPAFIEEMVSVVFPSETREKFISALKVFENDCKDQLGASFISLDSDQKKVFLNQKNDELKGRKSENAFFRMVKELTVVGYFTTEYGATQVLQYQAIPVEYHGCQPIEEAGNGKTWAT
ncbi:gluconate 2-dehydrogenase subunit 3 family protein [Marinoscillum furvescens]|uniref:Gluconate 2-dehydrogenase subunit 3-like protein n=1 Tax=Marinoscillum furvescens DSM 4134 TaxID=1122208 RepID=A0A3D9L5I0_MARFU|nr:gluconate 2-dehydrogenase subunit 3 family protein [Marinoscillum furvescens]RED99889.1 gluconate 2-dehydrogenase subunit 3-like protein [Marinoscillum furvescens DSM 4134]